MTLFGIFMLVREWQYAKAEFPIVVTLFGMFMLVMESQPQKAEFPIVVSKRIRDASRYTSKKISLKLLFLSDIFLFPFVRQQITVLA